METNAVAPSRVVVDNFLDMEALSVALNITKELHMHFSVYSVSETADTQQDIVKYYGHDTRDD